MDKISGFLPVESQVLSILSSELLRRQEHGDLHLPTVICHFQSSCWEPRPSPQRVFAFPAMVVPSLPSGSRKSPRKVLNHQVLSSFSAFSSRKALDHHNRHMVFLQMPTAFLLFLWVIHSHAWWGGPIKLNPTSFALL